MEDKVQFGMKLSLCATVDGVAACWGSNWYGELGIGAAGDPVSTPLRLELPVQKVVAGSHHTCALRANGTVRCWGDNASGQLGDGGWADRASPEPVAGLQRAVAVSAGTAHTCALLASGHVSCWGAGGLLLGVDSKEPDVRIPKAVLQPPSPATVANYPGD